ncbi:MAG TPA: RNA-binding protein [Burkholderiales bacterium]|nr:RNA-binding protein [Burkholderiales bacterium]
MRLWVGNLSPGTTDEDLSALLQKYGLPPCTAILNVQGDGSRPGALVTFTGVASEALYKAALLLDGLYWKQRSLAVQVFLH